MLQRNEISSFGAGFRVRLNQTIISRNFLVELLSIIITAKL